jgi:hypothetical protein
MQLLDRSLRKRDLYRVFQHMQSNKKKNTNKKNLVKVAHYSYKQSFHFILVMARGIPANLNFS